MFKKVQKYFISALLILLSGCASTPIPALDECPTMGLIRDADSIPIFSGVSNSDHIGMIGSIAGLKGDCKAGANGALEIDLNLGLVATRGPLGVGITEQIFPYFIATLDDKGDIVEKNAYEIKIPIGVEKAAIENANHTLVIQPDVNVTRIIAGFILSPEQATFNRVTQQRMIEKKAP